MRRGVIFGVLVMVAGIVLGVSLVISAFLTVTRTVNDFARIGFDEPTDLVFDESGEYTVYFEALDLDPGTEAPISLSVTRLADDEAVDIERYDGDATYTKDGREGQAAFTIDIPAAGAYRVDAGLAIDDAGSALAFGTDIGGDLLRRILWGVVLAVIVIALGLAIVVVSIARGSFEPSRSGAAAGARSTAPLRKRSGATLEGAEPPAPPPRPSSWAQVGRAVRDDPRRALSAARAARQDPRAAAEALLGDDADAVFEQFQEDPEAAVDGVLDRVASTSDPPSPATTEELADLPPPPPGPTDRPAPPPAPAPPAPPPTPAAPAPPAPPPAWGSGSRPMTEPEPAAVAEAPEPQTEPEPAPPEPEPEPAPPESQPEPPPEPEPEPAPPEPQPEPVPPPQPAPEPAIGSDGAGLVDSPTGYVPTAVAPPPPAAPATGPETGRDEPAADEPADEEADGVRGWQPEDLTPPPQYTAHQLTPPPSY